MTTIEQSKLLGLLVSPAHKADRADVVYELCKISSAVWSWNLIGIWLWPGLAAEDYPDATARALMVELIVTRITFWQQKDQQLGFSYDTIAGNMKPGIDLLVRVANFDQSPDVRMGALEALEALGEAGALTCLFWMTNPYGYDAQSRHVVEIARQLKSGALN